jgi:iron complex outermembrane receptor protein
MFRAAICAALCWFACAETATGQGQQKPPKPPDPPKGEPPKEVGGRLVVTGETVVVRANADEPVHTSSIATKTDTPLLETSRSISITDRRTLDDLSAINITQAHDVTPGVTPLDERGPASVRGFPVSFYDLRRDGLRTFSWSVREPASLDRVQYLRGPAGVLYGDGSPGGLVNLVVKKPLTVPRYEVSAAAGSLGFARVTADATGPVASAGGVRYRFIVAAEGIDNGFDNDERRLTVYPMVSFDLGKRATLHLDTEWYDQRGRGYRHVIPATEATARGDFSSTPWDLNPASPDDGWEGSNVSPGVRFDARLGDRTTLHIASRYTGIDGDLDFHSILPLAADGRTLPRIRYREISEWREYQSDGFLTTTTRWMGMDHSVVFGVEAGLSTTDSEIGISLGTPLNLFAPVYGPAGPDPALASTDYDTSRLGTYVLDQVHVTSNVIVAPGIRWSRLRNENNLTLSAGGVDLEPVSAETQWSPTLGVVVLPRPWLSVYGSYSGAFEPPIPGQFLEDRRPADFSESDSFEAGVKADLLGGRISATGSFFKIRQTNVLEADPTGFYRQIGEGKSGGVELELVGSVTRGLGIRAGYAFLRTEITRDAAGFVGRDLPNAPPHKFNLWMRYRFPSGVFDRLMVAGGVVYVADRYTDRTNTIPLAAYTRLDLTARYELAGPKLTLGLSAFNVADTRYVTSGAGRNLWVGAPRRLALEVGAAF